MQSFEVFFITSDETDRLLRTDWKDLQLQPDIAIKGPSFSYFPLPNVGERVAFSKNGEYRDGQVMRRTFRYSNVTAADEEVDLAIHVIIFVGEPPPQPIQ